jgi:hypothetical protein
MFHLIATKTVVPSLKSARDYCSNARPPVIIASSADPLVIYDRAASLGSGQLIQDLHVAINGCPLFQTGDLPRRRTVGS